MVQSSALKELTVSLTGKGDIPLQKRIDLYILKFLLLIYFKIFNFFTYSKILFLVYNRYLTNA